MKKLAGKEEDELVKLVKEDLILIEKKIVQMEKLQKRTHQTVVDMSNSLIPMYLEWRKEKDQAEKESRRILYG